MTPVYILLFAVLAFVFSSLLTVTQGTIAVITLFGKYQRILTPGLVHEDSIFGASVPTYFHPESEY